MKKLSYLKQNNTQRITYDEVMTRIGELSLQNSKNTLASVMGRNSQLIKGGQFVLNNLLTFQIVEDSFWLHLNTPTEVIPAAQDFLIDITLDAESSGNDRIDLIEARAILANERSRPIDIINEVSGVVSESTVDTDQRMNLETRVTKGTAAGSPVAPTSEGLTLCKFITDGLHAEDEVDYTTSVNLSALINIKLSIDDSAFKTIDVSGATPSSTSGQEIVNNINADAEFSPLAISKVTQTFTSSGTTVNINTTSHGLVTGHTVVISASTNLGDLPSGVYEVSVVDSDNFEVTTAAAGDDAGGTCSWDFNVAVLIDTETHIKIQSPTNTESSKIRFMAPTSADASALVLGLILDTNYWYKFEPTYEYFKIGEVLVQNGAASLIESDLRDCYDIDSWTTTSDNDTKVYNGSLQNQINLGIVGSIHQYKVAVGGELEEQSSPDMTFKVLTGGGTINGSICEWGEINSGIITAPGSNTRLDYITIDSITKTLAVVTGTPAVNPVFPSVSASQLILGCLVTKSTTTSLNYGKEIFIFKNGNNQYFPNLYINSAYTATSKLHNNVVVDIAATSITGTLECQGDCWIANYDGGGTDGSGDTKWTGSMSPSGYTDSTQWTIKNVSHLGGGGNSLVGSIGGGAGAGTIRAYLGNNGSGILATPLVIKAFNVYIYNYDMTPGEPDDGTTAFDPNGDDATFPLGDFSIGSSGRQGLTGGTLTVTAINEFIILNSVDLSGSDGSNGGNTSAGSVGNLGGQGGGGGNGGAFVYTCKTFTNNGTFSQTGGVSGTAGVGSGGSDNNGNGTVGASGSAGSTTATLYDFTDGLPSDYADWVHPLYEAA